jgi:hypothetical protein
MYCYFFHELNICCNLFLINSTIYTSIVILKYKIVRPLARACLVLGLQFKAH